MIHPCQYCGWRINERNDVEDDSNIGKCLLYKNKPFCSDECIMLAKNKPYVFSLGQPLLNPYEFDVDCDVDWKTNRKIGRKRQMRKLYRIYTNVN